MPIVIKPKTPTPNSPAAQPQSQQLTTPAMEEADASKLALARDHMDKLISHLSSLHQAVDEGKLKGVNPFFFVNDPTKFGKDANGNPQKLWHWKARLDQGDVSICDSILALPVNPECKCPTNLFPVDPNFDVLIAREKSKDDMELETAKRNIHARMAQRGQKGNIIAMY